MAFTIFILMVDISRKTKWKISCLKAKPQVLQQQMPMNENVLSFQHFVWYVELSKISLVDKSTRNRNIEWKFQGVVVL